MDKTKTFFTSLGVLFLIASAVLRFIIAPDVALRIPTGWSWSTQMVGTQVWADSLGNFPKEVGTSIYTRSISITDESKRPNGITLEDKYTVNEPMTDKVIWQYIYSASVDPATGRHLTPEFRDEYYVFPSHAERTTYTIRTNYVKGVPMQFVGEETIGDLKVYVYAYVGRGEYTESYEGTPEFPGTKVEPGQEIKCKDDQFKFECWIEPITGELIKLEESCHSGDYVYDIATGKPLIALSQWGGMTAGDDVKNRVEMVSSKRSAILWSSLYGPLVLVLAAVLSFIIGIRKKGIEAQ